MQVQTNQIILIVIGITLFFLLVAALLILYIYVYNNKKKQHAREKISMQEQFRNTLLQSQLEVQEQTRQHIAQELHDNVGALSSLIKINLNLISKTNSEQERSALIADSKELVKTMIADLKQLVIGLNTNVIRNQGLVNAIKADVDRIEKMQLFAIQFSVTGEERAIKEDSQIILYRICQELLHNIVKHAQPKQVNISMMFDHDHLQITLADDGVGFDTAAAFKKPGASGLSNLYDRTALIGGSLYLKSQPGKGTDCLVQIPYA